MFTSLPWGPFPVFPGTTETEDQKTRPWQGTGNLARGSTLLGLGPGFVTNNGVTRLASFTISSKVVFTGRQGRPFSRRLSSLAPTGARLLPLHRHFPDIKSFPEAGTRERLPLFRL